MATSEFEIFLSYQTNKLSKLKTGNLLATRIKLSQNYDDYLLATLLCEITEQVVEERLPDLKLYHLLTTALDNLVTWEDNISSAVFYVATIKMIWFTMEFNNV
ncbi:DNA repair protein RecO C-terminal domain-containing protein [Spiroplasma endosymbiont of Stenodema calcarata]|uniref:DNA repair protein RecO C-terminal domain-containing protein n=1 Tax=Spiroplasma endosymbiont of Stenodema calcarata TaxID=3139328 RepID=UPI003CCADF6A